MTIMLEKHQRINLSKESAGLKHVTAQLSWTTPQNVIPKYDADVSAFGLGADTKLVQDEFMVFYNNRTSPDGSISLSKDEREGGVEELKFDLSAMSPSVKEVSVVVTIHKAKAYGHSFDRITDSKIVIINSDTGETLAKFELSALPAGTTAVHVGSFYMENNEFSFHAMAEPYVLELVDFVEGYSK